MADWYRITLNLHHSPPKEVLELISSRLSEKSKPDGLTYSPITDYDFPGFAVNGSDRIMDNVSWRSPLILPILPGILHELCLPNTMTFCRDSSAHDDDEPWDVVESKDVKLTDKQLREVHELFPEFKFLSTEKQKLEPSSNSDAMHSEIELQ